jgi:hypothetical protein
MLKFIILSFVLVTVWADGETIEVIGHLEFNPDRACDGHHYFLPLADTTEGPTCQSFHLDANELIEIVKWYRSMKECVAECPAPPCRDYGSEQEYVCVRPDTFCIGECVSRYYLSKPEHCKPI